MNPLLNMPREKKKGVRKKDFLEDRAFLKQFSLPLLNKNGEAFHRNTEEQKEKEGLVGEYPVHCQRRRRAYHCIEPKM